MSNVTEKSSSYAQPSSDSTTAPYRQRVDEVLAALGTDSQRGLSDAETRARLEKYCRNELTAEEPS